MSQDLMEPHAEVDYEKSLLTSAYKKIKELYHFIEMTEALTYDEATATRIRTFLKEEGIWKP